MSTAVMPAARRRTVQTKHVLWAVFTLLTLFVALTRDRTLLDPSSFLRQRYSAIPVLMFLHGIPGAIALLLGFFQFSSRIRQKHLQLHRVMGRIYVGAVLISAPVAVIVAIKLPIPTLLMASAIQAFGWLACTLTALYCVRNGKIQQHREWMMRGYPFAMVFVVVRVIVAIPPVAAAGLTGLAGTVWSVIAVACFLPSFLIEWQKLVVAKPAAKAQVAAGD